MSTEPRRHWWGRFIAITLVAVAVLSAVMLRYDFRPTGANSVYFVRVDRWTGAAVIGYFDVGAGGHWVPGRRPQ